MRIVTAVFEFLQAAIQAAQSNTPLEGAVVREYIEGEMKEIRTILVGGLDNPIGGIISQSKPSKVADGSIREFDAFTALKFFAQPENAKAGSKFDAAVIAHEMAITVAGLILDDMTLGGRVCDCDVVQKLDGWSNVRTRRTPTSYLLLAVNRRSSGKSY